MHIVIVASLLISGGATPLFEAMMSTNSERLILLFGQAILFSAIEKYNKE
jgi:hypothetical protein